MYTSFTTLVKSENRYALVMQASILGYFFVSLLIIYASFFGFAYNFSIVKGGGVVREYVLGSWLTHIGTDVLRWHVP